MLLLAALSPATALRPTTLNGHRASIDRRAVLGAGLLAVAAPGSAFAYGSAGMVSDDPNIREAQNLLDFEDRNAKGSDSLAPKASVKMGGLSDIKVEMNVDANGDQRYLWFTNAETRKVVAAKAVPEFGKDRGSFATRLPAGITVIPTQYSRAYGVWEGARHGVGACLIRKRALQRALFS